MKGDDLKKAGESDWLIYCSNLYHEVEEMMRRIGGSIDGTQKRAKEEHDCPN